MNKINKKFLSEQFMSEVENDLFLLELKQHIYESYNLRLSNNISQKEWANIKEMSIMSVRRIENGTCYDARLISRYIK